VSFCTRSFLFALFLLEFTQFAFCAARSTTRV
jgi:hypothetical protein